VSSGAIRLRCRYRRVGVAGSVVSVAGAESACEVGSAAAPSLSASAGGGNESAFHGYYSLYNSRFRAHAAPLLGYPVQYSSYLNISMVIQLQLFFCGLFIPSRSFYLYYIKDHEFIKTVCWKET
jgi:hypothetical protein